MRRKVSQAFLNASHRKKFENHWFRKLRGERLYERCDCRRCQITDASNHFSCCMIALFPLSLRDPEQLRTLIGIELESEIRMWPKALLLQWVV